MPRHSLTKPPVAGPSASAVVVNGVLFDLDGVLVDSTDAVERHWRLFADWYDLDPESLLRHVHGRRSRDIVTRFAAQLPVSVEQALARYQTLDIEDQDGVAVLPGAADLLRSLPPHAWAIVTSGSREVAAARLNATGLPIPEIMITADMVEHGKPHPDPYRQGIRALRLEPQQTLAVEDAPPGLASAAAAGARTLALTTTHTAEQVQAADYLVGDLTAVTATADQNTVTLQLQPSPKPAGWP